MVMVVMTVANKQLNILNGEISRGGFEMGGLWKYSLLYVLISWTCIHFVSSILKRSRLSSMRLPPGPLPLPVVGNILKLGTKPHRSLSELAKVYGPVISLELGHVTTIVVSSVDMAKQVLLNHDASFSYRADLDLMTLNDHAPSSIVFLDPGTKWRAMRRICASHVFSGTKLDSISSRDIRRKKVQELMSYIEDCSQEGTPVSVSQAAFNTILNLISFTFFSKDLADPYTESGREFKELICAILELSGQPNLAEFFPLLKAIDPQGIRRRFQVLSDKMLNFFDTLIKERLEKRKSLGDFGSLEKNNIDVLDSIIIEITQGRNHGEEEVKLSDLPHLFGDLFSAGVDTTTSTIEWAMAELLRQPDKLKKAQAELEDMIGKGKQLEEADIGRLTYLQAVVKETLRLHPPVPFLVPRKVIADVKLGNKYTVPKNARVLVNTWAMGRDPSIWDRPNSFEPERFLGSQIDFKGRDFELIPFGSGRRICPGLLLGSRMLHLVVGSLIHSFDWKLKDDGSPMNMDMEEKFGFTLAKAQPLIAIPIHKYYF
ncbi:hypothetical protein Dimus_028305 [Dionaea muscipula]